MRALRVRADRPHQPINLVLFVKQPTHHRHQHGFTLVELLVTMTIVIILVAISFTIFRSVRTSADVAVATSRLRGLAQANINYATDHNGRFVPIFAFDERGSSGEHWIYNPEFWEMFGGDQSFLEDPEEHEGKDGYPESVLDPVVVRAKARYWSRVSASFGYNWENTPGGSWEQRGSDPFHTMTTMKTPSQTCQFVTATDWIAKYSGRLLWEQMPAEGKTEDGKIAYRHKGKAIVAYYDGHTAMITPEDMKEIDRRGGIDNMFWGGDQR